MEDLKTILSKVFDAPRMQTGSDDPRQRNLMVASLALLILALIIVFWRNADFWFPDTPAVESAGPLAADQPTSRTRSAHHKLSSAIRPRAAKKENLSAQDRLAGNRVVQNQIAQNAAGFAPPGPASPDPPPVSIGPRTVLPPMDVEVVAGDSHRTVRPASNSVHVQMQPDTSTPAPEAGGNHETETAAAVTSEAGERMLMSGNTAEIVAEPVRPNYPLLARQMKVQGSVILEALIGKDGWIQNLRVLSGPQILASAAEDAVRQWRFKPHFEGSQAVETETHITVNFTISTN